MRSRDGRTEVLEVPPEARRFVRRNPEAFLATKVLVCEGRTEMGLCRALDEFWQQRETVDSFACLGVALADGGGRDAPKVAQAFRSLGFDVALLGDSDHPLNPDEETLTGNGVRVLLWGAGLALEQRLVEDLPPEGVIEVVRLAMEEWGEDAVRSSVSDRLQSGSLGPDPACWFEEHDPEDLRRAIASGAMRFRNGDGWFKRVDLAEALARVLFDHAPMMRGTDTVEKIRALREWVKGD